MAIQRADMALLNGSLDDLSRTLLAAKGQREQSRQFDSASSQRREENAMDRALRTEEFGLRREDAKDARDIRREGLEVSRDTKKSIEEYRRDMLAAKNDEEKFRIFETMGKNGMLTDEGIAAMEKQFAEKLGGAGLGVKLFKVAKPSAGFNTQASHNLKLAEDYRARAAAATDPKQKASLTAIADRLERSVGPESKADDFSMPDPAADPYSEDRTAEEDAMGAALGEKPGLMERALSQRGRSALGVTPKTGGIPAHGPPQREGLQSVPPELQAPGLAGGEERVAVVSPTGKRGSVSRSKLEAALKEGYKLAQ